MKIPNQRNKGDSQRGGNYGITNKIKERVLKAYDKEFGRHTDNAKRNSRPTR